MKIIKKVLLVITLIIGFSIFGAYMLVNKAIIMPIENVLNPQEEGISIPEVSELELANAESTRNNAEDIAEIKRALSSNKTSDKLEALQKAITVTRSANASQVMELHRLISTLANDIELSMEDLQDQINSSDEATTQVILEVYAEIEDAAKEADRKRCMDLELRNADRISKLKSKLAKAKSSNRIKRLTKELNTLKCQL